MSDDGEEGQRGLKEQKQGCGAAGWLTVDEEEDEHGVCA
jgi:hypothetical protein